MKNIWDCLREFIINIFAEDRKPERMRPNRIYQILSYFYDVIWGVGQKKRYSLLDNFFAYLFDWTFFDGNIGIRYNMRK